MFRPLCVVLLLLGSIGSAGASAPPPDLAAFEPINRIVGDTSWVLQTGRAPTAADDAVSRAAVHLAFVESQLSGRDVSALSKTQTARRHALLRVLHQYRLAREFPRHSVAATEGPALLPRFIDDDGRHCAVGHLIKASGHPALAAQINQAYEYGYLLDIAKTEPRVGEWAHSHGFAVHELAMIQPSYSNRPDLPMPTKWESHVAWVKTMLKNTPMQVVMPQTPTPEVDASYIAAGFNGPTNARGLRHGLWVTPLPKVVPPSNAPITKLGQPKTEDRATLMKRRATACKDTRWKQDPACASLAYIHFENGKRHGEELRFDATGRLAHHGHWKHGKRVGSWLTTDGMVTRVTYNSQGQLHGKVVTTSRGQEVTTGSYRRGLKHGSWTMRFKSSWRNDRVTGQFVDGVRVGIWHLHRFASKKDPLLLGSATYSDKGAVIELKPEGTPGRVPGE